MLLLRFKELIVILAIAALVFHFAKPIALRFMTAEDFTRRRFVWLLLTVVSFLSPSIWLYAVVAVPTLIWATRKDSNPIGLYMLMLHVIPPVNVIIPILGNNGLFPLNNYRLLSFCLLIPVALRYRKSKNEVAPGTFGMMDILLLTFGVLDVALYLPPDLPQHLYIPDSPSNMLRRAVLFMLDTYVLYYAVSRSCQTRQKVMDVAASFCLACAVMAGLAIFENLRTWLLYIDVVRLWAGDPAGFYLLRNGALRAQTSAGHALALGYLLALGSGFWLFLKSRDESRLRRIGATLLFWGGLLATFSRGPWLGAVTVYFAFNAARPGALSRVIKGAVAAVVVIGIIALSPIGDRILNVLPVMGHAADANIVYRQKLADRGWQLVMDHPLFGEQYSYPDLEELRQGEGIIDFVNTYLSVALDYGFVGLTVFMAFILLALSRVYARAKEFARSDPDLALFGAGLVACIVGTLVMIQSNSFALGLEIMFYVLAGLGTAYSKLGKEQQQEPAATPAAISAAVRV